eukprot:GHVS01084676.1.p2 GENE.GHVS01084676.1~~GHVS01084676.1.p2  ORF type:complete len:345 (-),score=64.72 GHVS01084676.1:1596-2600(-)
MEDSSRVLQLVLAAAALTKPPPRSRGAKSAQSRTEGGRRPEGGQEVDDNLRERGGRSGGSLAVRRALLSANVVHCSDAVRALVVRDGEGTRNKRNKRRIEQTSAAQRKRTKPSGRLTRAHVAVLEQDQDGDTAWTDFPISEDAIAQEESENIAADGVLGIRSEYGITLNHQSLLVRGVVNIYISQVTSFCRDTHLFYSRITSCGVAFFGGVYPVRRRSSLPADSTAIRRRPSQQGEEADDSLLLGRLPEVVACWPSLADASHPQQAAAGMKGRQQDYEMFRWEEDGITGNTAENVLAAELERLTALGFTNANIGRPEELQLSPDIGRTDGSVRP